MATKKDYKIQFGGVNHQNADSLKLMVNKTFPLTYNDNLYTKIALHYKTFSFFSYLDDIQVGGVSCRVEPRGEAQVPSLYILILTVLPRYRRGNIATKLLNEVIKRVHEEKEAQEVKTIYLHTPIHNEAAIKFYEKNGFSIAEKMVDYYKTFENPERNTAVVLEYVVKRGEQTEDHKKEEATSS